MNKAVKNSLMITAIIIVLFGIIWFVYDMFKKEPVETNVNANLVDGNAGLDNMINELFENIVDNEVAENGVNDKTENEVAGDAEKDDNKKQENEEDATQLVTEDVTTREEKAIELVKKEWGSTDGVYFSNESIDTEGRYIVSVRDKKKTTSLAFYVVDVDKQLVTEQ